MLLSSGRRLCRSLHGQGHTEPFFRLFVDAEQTENNALRNSPLVVQYFLESGTLDHNDVSYGLGAGTVGTFCSSDSPNNLLLKPIAIVCTCLIKVRLLGVGSKDILTAHSLNTSTCRLFSKFHTTCVKLHVRCLQSAAEDADDGAVRSRTLCITRSISYTHC